VVDIGLSLAASLIMSVIVGVAAYILFDFDTLTSKTKGSSEMPVQFESRAGMTSESIVVQSGS